MQNEICQVGANFPWDFEDCSEPATATLKVSLSYPFLVCEKHAELLKEKCSGEYWEYERLTDD